MATGVTTTTQDLGDSRVRVDVEVEPDTLEREVDRAAQTLSGDIKVPGFRQGHVPAPVVIQRLGREAVLDEAVRRALPGCTRRRCTTRGSSPWGTRRWT